jgi:hypothetical protein
MEGFNMARKTFFSFHYKDDNWRAGIVRNSWVTQDRTVAGFFDSADWEKVKKEVDSEIEKWINEQLNGTSVTVVLIGENTYGRKWINYEITSSWKKGNGLLGIYINNVLDQNRQTTTKGKNPFEQWKFKKSDKEVLIPVYDWVKDNGYENIGNWIEKAAKEAGK